MSNNLCWNCQNACGGCSWSENLTPVEGWTATPVKVKRTRDDMRGDIETYHIEACPEYKPDAKYLAECEKRGRKPGISEAEKALVRTMRKQGCKYSEITTAMKLSMIQIGRILREAGMTDKQRRVSLDKRAEIKQLLKKGYSKGKIATLTGVSAVTILKIEREGNVTD